MSTVYTTNEITTIIGKNRKRCHRVYDSIFLSSSGLIETESRLYCKSHIVRESVFVVCQEQQHICIVRLVLELKDLMGRGEKCSSLFAIILWIQEK